MMLFLADFLNPNNYDNGTDLRDLINAQGQNNWLMCIAIGTLFFIAFSSRFKP